MGRERKEEKVEESREESGAHRTLPISWPPTGTLYFSWFLGDYAKSPYGSRHFSLIVLKHVHSPFLLKCFNKMFHFSMYSNQFFWDGCFLEGTLSLGALKCVEKEFCFLFHSTQQNLHVRAFWELSHQTVHSVLGAVTQGCGQLGFCKEFQTRHYEVTRASWQKGDVSPVAEVGSTKHCRRILRASRPECPFSSQFSLKWPWEHNVVLHLSDS